MQKTPVTLEDLRLLLTPTFYKEIIIEAKLGDSDWLFDIVGELDYIRPESIFYLDEFHAPLQALGLTSKSFNFSSTMKYNLWDELEIAQRQLSDDDPDYQKAYWERYKKNKIA